MLYIYIVFHSWQNTFSWAISVQWGQNWWIFLFSALKSTSSFRMNFCNIYLHTGLYVALDSGGVVQFLSKTWVCEESA